MALGVRIDFHFAYTNLTVRLHIMASWVAMQAMPGICLADQQPRSWHISCSSLPARPHPARRHRCLTSACCQSAQRPDRHAACLTTSAASLVTEDRAAEHGPEGGRHSGCSTALARVAVALTAVSGAGTGCICRAKFGSSAAECVLCSWTWPSPACGNLNVTFALCDSM